MAVARRSVASVGILVAGTALILYQTRQFPLMAILPGIAATLAQLLLPIAAFVLAKPPTAARRWLGFWGATFFLSDVAQLSWSRVLGNNLAFVTFLHPVEDGILMWAYSYWQRSATLRLAVRISIPIFVLVYFGIALKTSELNAFKQVAGPFRSLVMLVLVVSTLLQQLSQERFSFWNKDWLWASLGIALYFGVYVSVEPIAKALSSDREMTFRVYSMKAGFDLLAFLLVFKALRCPMPRASTPSLLEPDSRSL